MAINEIVISTKTEIYIQLPVLKKTLECISFDRQRNIEEDDGNNEVDALVNKIAVTLTIVKSEDILQQYLTTLLNPLLKNGLSKDCWNDTFGNMGI